MSVLRRNMFRGGGYAHRGTGITSGLVPRYSHGGPVSEHTEAEKFEDYMKMFRDMGIAPERKPFSKLAAASPALLNLSGALLSGRSYQGGVGGALDILGQGLTASAPGFAQAIKARREYEATDPEASLKATALQMALKKDDPRYEWKVQGDNLIKIDTLGKEEPVVTALPTDPKLQGEPNTVYGKFAGIDDPTYAQEFIFEDGESEYRIGDQIFKTFEPMEKPKDAATPIKWEKSLPNNMVQEMISYNNGIDFEKFGNPYPRFKPDKPEKVPQWQYKSTIDKTIERDGNKFKQTYALYAKEGQVEPKKVMIFEEEVTGDPQVRKSGNIVITDGENKGMRRAGLEFKDGVVRYYDPSSPDAAMEGPYDGFVDVKDKYEWYNQEVAGGPETIFGEPNAEKVAIAASSTANTLASGAGLINDALTIGGNLDSLNRSILDKGGKLLSQIPILGEDMKAALYAAFDQDQREIQKFITNSRIFVAQNIATITGEGSSRVSEPERFLANQALATLDTMTDAESSIAAIQASLAATYVQQHRQLKVAGAKVMPVSGDGKNGFDEAGAVYHANILATKFGFSKKDIARTLTVMRDMEDLGLQQLTTITNAQNDYFKNNKQDIQAQYAALLPDVTGGVLD